jgi:hypothetical protein
MRRLTGLLAATAITFTSIAFASPAHAAAVTIPLSCTLTLTLSPTTVVANSGDFFDVVPAGIFSATVTLSSGVTGPTSFNSSAGAQRYTVNTNSGGSLTFLATSGGCNGSSATLTFTGSGGGGGGGTGATSVQPILLPPVEHSLGFNSNGGTCELTNSGPIIDGAWTQVPTAEQCTRPGYTLLGWNPNPDGSDPLGFDPGGFTVMTDDNTLYAIWVPIR